MTYDEYQSALTAALKTYRAVPKTPESIDAYQKQANALHQQYRLAKMTDPAREQKQLNNQRILDDRITKYENDLVRLSTDVRDYQQAYDTALRSKTMADAESYDGGEVRRENTRRMLARTAELLNNAKAKLARLNDPRKYQLPVADLPIIS